MGCDVGALFTKLVLMDDEGVMASRIVRTTGRIAQESSFLISDLLEGAQITRTQLAFIGATGSGGDQIKEADFYEDEVTCVGAAVSYFLPDVELALQIGGQSIAAVHLNDDGEVIHFSRNDKCAAGTGRFLEMMSHRLGQAVESLDQLVAQSTQPYTVSSQCVVFAESEAISHINAGVAVPDIVAGMCSSIGRMVAAQGRRARGAQRFTLTGGVARFKSVVSVVEARLGKIYRPFPVDPQLAAALGAALLEDDEE